MIGFRLPSPHRSSLKFGLLFFFSLPLLTFSQSGATVQPPAPIDDPMGITADLTNVDLEFCNQYNTSNQKDRLITSIKPGQDLDICLSLYNNNDKPATLVMGFVDGAYTVDATQKKSCKSNEFVERFGQYVSGYTSPISLGPNETTTTHATLSLPSTAIGIHHGCLVFSLNPGYGNSGTGQFDVIVRKGHFIDVMVEGAIESTLNVVEPFGLPQSDNITNNPLLYAHRTPMGSVAVVVGLDNNGNLDENVDAQLTIKNILGHVVGVYKESKIIMNQHQENLNFKLESFPRYKGYFFADLELTHRPMGGDLDASETLTQSASFFMFPVWATLSVIVLMILVNLFFSIRRINAPKTK